MGLTGDAAVAEATRHRLTYQTLALKNPLYSAAYGRMEARSKYRLATITTLWSTLDRLRNDLDKYHIDTPRASEIRGLRSELPKIDSPMFKYTNMTHQEKVEVVEKMDEIAGAILKMLRHS